MSDKELLRECALKIEHYAADREDRGLSTEHEAVLLARITAALEDDDKPHVLDNWHPPLPKGE